MAGHEPDADAASGEAVAAAAADLYALPLGEFTAARGERARQARDAGDAAAARAIGRLGKPSVVAWLANQLARAAPGDIEALLALGASMRRATADLDAAGLRAAAGEQRDLIQSLAAAARDLARAAGQAFSDTTARGLQETLHAALADEQAATALARGQLTAGLARSGFPGIDAAAADTGDGLPSAWATGPPAPRARRGAGRAAPEPAPADETAAPARGSGQGATGPGPDGKPGRRPGVRPAGETRRKQLAAARREQLERARRAEAAARDDAAEASREDAAAQARLSEAGEAAAGAAADIDRLQDELDAAIRARDAAGRAQRQARRDADRTARLTRQADRRLAEATARREELESR